jgi:hypothetical protein
LGSRPTAGHAALDRSIGVRIPAPQLTHAPVAQLDRASDFGSEGWGFKSLWARFSKADSGEAIYLTEKGGF